MIRECDSRDLNSILAVINDAAQAYRGIIPPECWHEPYMEAAVLSNEADAGVSFWGYQMDGELIGVMGVQSKGDVTLIRHAYVRTMHRNRGIGGKLLQHLYNLISGPVLIGTWADAVWAVGFYRKHGFTLISKEQTMGLLRKYWTATEEHFQASVVLADPRWFTLQKNVQQGA